MASSSDLSSSPSYPRSHVIVLTIPDDAIEDVSHILERFSFHRGWSSQISSFVDRESAVHVAERCVSSILQQSSSPSAQLGPPPFQYPATEREVSLLIPDRVDARSVVDDPSSHMSDDVMSGPAQLTLRDRLHDNDSFCVSLLILCSLVSILLLPMWWILFVFSFVSCLRRCYILFCAFLYKVTNKW